MIGITENYFFFLVNSKIFFGTRNRRLVQISIAVRLLQEDDGAKWILEVYLKELPAVIYFQS